MRTWLAFLVWVTLGSLLWAQEFPRVQFHAFREELTLAMPSWNPKLAQSCQRRAEELLKLGELSHVDGQGRGPGFQMSHEGFPAGTFGEVLGAGVDPMKVWEAWLASAAHRRILDDPFWTFWGSGQAGTGSRVVYVVRFWRP